MVRTPQRNHSPRYTSQEHISSLIGNSHRHTPPVQLNMFPGSTSSSHAPQMRQHGGGSSNRSGHLAAAPAPSHSAQTSRREAILNEDDDTEEDHQREPLIIGVLDWGVSATPDARLSHQALTYLALSFRHSDKRVALLDLNTQCHLTMSLLGDGAPGDDGQAIDKKVLDALNHLLLQPIPYANVMSQPRNIPSLPGIQLIEGTPNLHHFFRQASVAPHWPARGVLRHMARQLAMEHHFDVILVDLDIDSPDTTMMLAMNCDCLLPLMQCQSSSVEKARNYIENQISRWWGTRSHIIGDQLLGLQQHRPGKERDLLHSFVLPPRTPMLPLVIYGSLVPSIATGPTSNTIRTIVSPDFIALRPQFIHLTNLIPQESRQPNIPGLSPFLGQSSGHGDRCRGSQSGRDCPVCQSPISPDNYKFIEDGTYICLANAILDTLGP